MQGFLFSLTNGNRESFENNLISRVPFMPNIFASFTSNNLCKISLLNTLFPYLNHTSFVTSKNFLQLRDVTICKKFNADGPEYTIDNLIGLVIKLSGFPWDLFCQRFFGDRSKMYHSTIWWLESHWQVSSLGSVRRCGGLVPSLLLAPIQLPVRLWTRRAPVWVLRRKMRKTIITLLHPHAHCNWQCNPANKTRRQYMSSSQILVFKVVLRSKKSFPFFFRFWKHVRLTPNWQNFALWVLSEGCLFWV